MNEQTKHQWQTPELWDLDDIQITASGNITGTAEIHCNTAGNNPSYTTAFNAPTSGGPVSIACTVD